MVFHVGLHSVTQIDKQNVIQLFNLQSFPCAIRDYLASGRIKALDSSFTCYPLNPWISIQ